MSRRTVRRPSGRRKALSLAVTSLAILLTAGPAGAAQSPAGLGTAGSFGVLAGSSITNTGPSVINGDLAVSPGTAISGFPPGTVNGVSHSADAAGAAAQADAKSAYDDLAGRGPAATVTGDLGGLVLTAGVYRAASSIGLTGPVTLDAQGDSSAVFIFQIGSALTTASGSSVKLVNGANPCNVYWQIGSSATFGTGTVFAGTVLAQTSITMGDGVTLAGRALARTGAVTLINDRITVPTCTTASPPASTPAPGGTTSTAPGTPGATGTTGTTPGTAGTPDAPPGTAGQAPGTVTASGAAIFTTVPRSISTRITRMGTAQCIRGTFRTVITGRRIAKVVFSVGPTVLATRRSGPFQAFVRPPRTGGVRTVVARVTFTDGTRPATVRLRYRACAAAAAPVATPSRPPRAPGGFTG
jgi:hypothetical protein